jgi:hypothetical protein
VFISTPCPTPLFLYLADVCRVFLPARGSDLGAPPPAEIKEKVKEIGAPRHKLVVQVDSEGERVSVCVSGGWVGGWVGESRGGGGAIGP